MSMQNPVYNEFATDLKQIEKVYCNTHNHDVKAPVVYGVDNQLFADAEFTKPVSKDILEDLFFAGVVIKTFTNMMVTDSAPIEILVKPIMCAQGALIVVEPMMFAGFDVEANDWAGV